MRILRRSRPLRAAAAALLGSALIAGTALATPGSGLTATLFGRGALPKSFEVKSDGIELEAERASDVAVQTITFDPKGTSGWHMHPGVVIVLVQSGTLTHYDRKCKKQVYTAGQAFVEARSKGAGTVVNEGAAPAVVYVTYVAPAGSALRIDAPAPSCTTTAGSDTND